MKHDPDNPSPMAVPEALSSLLRCPDCHGNLIAIDSEQALACQSCEARFPVRDRIPIMLPGLHRVAYDELYGRMDFDAAPFGYDTAYASWRKGQINREITRHLVGGLVLDNGGGYGYLRQFLDPDRHSYFNVDCSIAILKFDPSPCRCVAEGERLPFADGSFENVVSGDVLEHVKDKSACLREAFRVLKPGGVFALNTPREGWLQAFRRSPWFWIPHLDRFCSRFRSENSQTADPPPDGVVDIPSDEEWLGSQLQKTGFEILFQSRTDNHLFGFTHAFWCRFADLLINPQRYGHCAFFACRKPLESNDKAIAPS